MKLELSLQEINLVLQAVADRPLREVADLFNKIQKQASEQVMAEQAPKEKKDDSVSPQQ